MEGKAGKFHLVDDGDIVMRPADVSALVTHRGWTLAQAAEYLGCSSSHVGTFLRRNGYRQQRAWGSERLITMKGENETEGN